MSNYKEKNQKNQVFLITSQRKNFEKFITVLSSLKESNDVKLLKFYKQLLFAEKLIFIPQGYSYSEKEDKIEKYPLENWHESKINLEKIKKRISEIVEDYEKKQYGKGVALKTEDYEIFVIDIDNLEAFQKHFGKIDEVLKELEKDAYLINKSLKRGYHVYIGSKIAERVKHFKIDNSMLKNSYGFEVKRKGLIVFPPSKLVHNGSTYECKLLYVNPENFNKEQIETSTLEKIFEIIEKESIKKYFSKSRIETINSVLSRKRRKYRDLKEIVREVKERVRIRDIIPEHYRGRGSDYETYICPFHPEDNPSFAVYLNHDGDYYIDFHDDEKGDVMAFYERLNHCDFITALKELCKEAGIEFPEREDKELKKKEESKIKVESKKNIREPFETAKAFYTKPTSIFKDKIKRYAIDKEENAIYEMVELIRTLTKEDTYVEDITNPAMKETLPLKEDWEIEIDDKKYYNYRAFFFQQLIANFNILEGVIIRDVLNLTPSKYDLTILTSNREKRIIKDKTIEEVLNSLRSDGLIARHQKIRDALSQLIDSLIKAQKIQIKNEIPYKGFFYDGENKKIVASKLQKREVEKEELRNALIFLDKVINEFYGHMKEKFVTILKWFTIAPLSFMAKQRRNFIKSLYLYGSSGAGKTKAGVLASQMWRTYQHFEGEGKTGASMDTIAKFGGALSKSTFPLLVNEPEAIFLRSDVKEALKNAITSTLAREKYIDSTQMVPIPALSNMCFTSNQFLPMDDAILRRMVVISFSLSDRKNRKSEREFAEILKKAENVLPVIGEVIVYHLEELEKWIIDVSEDNQFQVAEKILRFLHEKAELTAPEWLEYLQENEFTLEDAENEVRMTISLKLREIVMEKILRVSKLFDATMSFEDKVKFLLENKLLPWAIYQKSKETVFITTQILQALREHDIHGFPHLKALAETLDCEYVTHSFKQGKKKVSRLSVIKLSLKDFIEILSPEVEENQKKDGSEKNEEEIPADLISKDILLVDEEISESQKKVPF